ncbi:MAG: hypothetical protein JWO15_3831, partial [Sphingomonadales bacterium]|nr:hypothetical protein [Sphingomonadales bacterium]
MVRVASSTPRLSEVARHLVYPDGIVSTNWPRIAPRLADMAIEYDGWQEGVGTIVLGLDENGRYAATVGGVTMSLPRQVGKTFTVGSLLVAMCLEFPGLRVVWTSHHLRTTTNTFRSMQGMVRRKRIFPHLAPNGIRTANGEQEIKFANGSLVMFGAREHGFGVGIDAIDILVCDEAQRLSSRALADMMPTTNQARHAHGALVFFIGTPPRPSDMGDEFAARRAKALDGRMKNGVYVELSADDDADLDDPRQWARANASYPHRTPHESMLRLRENLTDDADWSREALGRWDESEKVPQVIPMTLWADLANLDPPADDIPPNALAVDMSHDRVIAIAGCWLDEDESHVEVLALDRTDDTLAAVEWIVERAGRRIPVAIDSMSPAASMIAGLKARKVKVITTNAVDMGKACGLFYDETIAGRLKHGAQQQVDDALAGAKKRNIRDAGSWGWDRKDPTVNIAPLVAVTLARFAAEITKKK